MPDRGTGWLGRAYAKRPACESVAGRHVFSAAGMGNGPSAGRTPPRDSGVVAQNAPRPRSPGVRGGLGGASLDPLTASRCGKTVIPHWTAIGRAGLYPSGRSGSGMDPPGFYGRKRWQSRKLLGSVAERPPPMEGVSGLPAQSVHSRSTGVRQLFDWGRPGHVHQWSGRAWGALSTARAPSCTVPTLASKRPRMGPCHVR